MGGNQGNEVCIAQYPKDDLLGFRLPHKDIEPIEVIRYDSVAEQPVADIERWKVRGKGVLINNGHSGRGNGAFSENGEVAEYDLNIRQARHISGKLRELGIPHHIINQTDVGNDLRLTGAAANGYDMFISLHHNSTHGAQYTCYLLGGNAKEGSKKFGPMVSERISRALGITDNGLLDMRVTVTNAAEMTDCPVVVLIESYFINSMENHDDADAWSDKAADAIVDAITSWFGN